MSMCSILCISDDCSKNLRCTTETLLPLLPASLMLMDRKILLEFVETDEQRDHYLALSHCWGPFASNHNQSGRFCAKKRWDSTQPGPGDVPASSSDGPQRLDVPYL
jgi:hypothetical protein